MNTPALPVLYSALEPLDAERHATLRLRDAGHGFAAHLSSVPLAVEEFALAGRHMPLVFAAEAPHMPVALTGRAPDRNLLIDAQGAWRAGSYVPAYLRRYPFLLAQLQEGSDELSLCVDPTSGTIGDGPDGEAIFDGDQPSARIKEILDFCEQFEAAGQRTGAFMADLQKAGLLMDGEVAIQPDGSDQPFVYRGFQMVDEEKLRDMRGDELRRMNQNGMLPLIFAHLFSLAQIRDIFSRQVTQGKGPIQVDAPVLPEPANA